MPWLSSPKLTCLPLPVLRPPEEQAALLAASSSALPSDKKKKKTKPMHLSDFQRRALLDASSSATGRPTADADEPTPWSHADEQARLREETLAAFGNAVESDDEDAADAGVFVKKSEAGPVGDELEDEEYRRFLVGNVGGGEAGVREALFGPGGFAQEGTAAKGASEEDEKARRKAEKKVRKAAKLEGGTAPAVVDPEARRKEEEEFLLECVPFPSPCFRRAYTPPLLPPVADPPPPLDRFHRTPQLHPQPRLDRPRDGRRALVDDAGRLVQGRVVQGRPQGRGQGRGLGALGRRGRRRGRRQRV